ncbi:MAG: type III-A CRISPR-associated RAMP protein Csm5 [Thermoplasmata archaeon]|nr:MAG: type III-A CRISPR-associated RAMP protein Csm5 [Thermoplasmata archaeon]
MKKVYRAIALSPIHVGSGEEITPVEYVVDDAFHRIDMDSLFEDPEFDRERFLKGLEGTFYLGTEFSEVAKRHRMYTIDLSDTTKKLFMERKPKVREFIRSCGRAYIPGSSLKGAIRTAILWYVLRNDPYLCKDAERLLKGAIDRGVSKKDIGKIVEKKVFGEDAKKDLLKCLHVVDTDRFSDDSMAVETVRILSTAGGRFRWEFDIPVEALKPGSEFIVEMKIDEKFLTPHAKRELGFDGKEGFIENMKNICGDFARGIADFEIEFFRKLDGRELEDIISFYRNLKAEEGFLLRISWGSGWHGMTIAWDQEVVDSDLLDEIRLRYGMGKIIHRKCGGEVVQDRRERGKFFCKRCKRGGLSKEEVEVVKPFPKTRRIVFRERKPKYPMGWLKLEEIR